MPQFRLILLAIALVVWYVASQAQTSYLPTVGTYSATDTAHLAAIETAIEALQADVSTGDTPVLKISGADGDVADDEFAICTGPCTITSIECLNTSASADAYLKIYNATTANTTPGTTDLALTPVLIPFGPSAHNQSVFLTMSVAATGVFNTTAVSTEHVDVPNGEVFCTVGKR